MNTNKHRVLIVLLFAVTFMFIGWVSPVLYATYAPQQQIMEVHEFSAQNATTDSENHFVCFDRTVRQPATGRTFTELYLVGDNSSSPLRTEIAFDSYDRYYQQGHNRVVTPLELPDKLEAGTYRYLLVIKMQLADGRVERVFTYHSEPFYISEPSGNEIEKPKPAC